MTGSVANPAPHGTSDREITAERDETKYLIARDHVETLCADLHRRLRPHRFTGEGANRLSAPQHFVTTIYFDTASRTHFRAATSGEGHDTKIRAKEYYDVHPSLAELATDPLQIVRYQPWLWFEMKRRAGTHIRKRRFRLPKPDVPALFADHRVSPDLLAAVEPGAAATDDIDEILDHCRALAEPLVADCLVNYQRLPWQDADGDLRVTLDLDLAMFAPPADLWTRKHALLRASLGPVRRLEPNAVLEVKSRGSVPGWLVEILDRAGARRAAFSKFVAASEAIHDGS